MKRKAARRSTRAAPGQWAHLRLRDRIAPGLRVLFVGINPGVRSALTGHHFAGFSNRFWKLLYESGVVPRPMTCEDDDRLHEWGFGVTNLVPRPTPGIGDLAPAELLAGRGALERKIRKYRPAIVVLVGVTLYRALFPAPGLKARATIGSAAPGLKARATIGSARKRNAVLGLRRETLAGARVFVLPNPSGRNAHFTYAEMAAAFRRLATMLRGMKR